MACKNKCKSCRGSKCKNFKPVDKEVKTYNNEVMIINGIEVSFSDFNFKNYYEEPLTGYKNDNK